MDIASSGKMRNYIYMAVLGLASVLIIIGLAAAGGQDRGFQEDYRHYQQASGLIGQGKYAAAQEILLGLGPGFGDSYQVQYRLGICAAALGHYDQAVDYMQKVREIRPAVLQEQSFLVDFGRILYLQGDFDMARLYLLESKKYDQSDQATARADQLLQQLAGQR